MFLGLHRFQLERIKKLIESVNSSCNSISGRNITLILNYHELWLHRILHYILKNIL